MAGAPKSFSLIITRKTKLSKCHTRMPHRSAGYRVVCPRFVPFAQARAGSCGQWHRGGRDTERYLTGAGKIYFWLVLASSGLVLASSGVLRSRGNNFQIKNVKILAEICWFECGISLQNPILTDLLDFPLYFLYKRKGKSSKSADFGSSGGIPHSNQPISANFWWI